MSYDNTILYEDSFDYKIYGQRFICSVKLLESSIAFLDFEYNGNNYSPIIFQFRSNLKKILTLFIKETNDESFGNLDYDRELNITLKNKHDFTLKVAKDFMSCFLKLMETYPKEVITYSAYYYLQKKENTYSTYIQDIVCKFILDKKILSKGTRFTIIDWK
jgi:hypothetical protein